jgi:hypothetical protein
MPAEIPVNGRGVQAFNQALAVAKRCQHETSNKLLPHRWWTAISRPAPEEVHGRAFQLPQNYSALSLDVELSPYVDDELGRSVKNALYLFSCERRHTSTHPDPYVLEKEKVRLVELAHTGDSLSLIHLHRRGCFALTSTS